MAPSSIPKTPPQPIQRNLLAGGSVSSFSDESFAEAVNLIKDHDPEFRFGVFVEGAGQKFDSWETRRHNEKAPDWVILALKKPSEVSSCEIDTKWHLGNHAEFSSLYGCLWEEEGVPTPDSKWDLLVERHKLEGHARHLFNFPKKKLSHVKLTNDPDGGISRLRLYEEPADQSGTIFHEEEVPGVKHAKIADKSPDSIQKAREKVSGEPVINLASFDLGATVVESSNERYGDSKQLLFDSPPINMGDGWETARTRERSGFQYVKIKLAYTGQIKEVRFDYKYFIFNNPLEMELFGTNSETQKEEVLIERMRVKEFAGKSLAVKIENPGEFSHLTLRHYPCGGVNRMQVLGNSSAGQYGFFV